MRTIFTVLATVVLLAATAPSALAQPEPLTVFEDSGLSGIYCSYEASESGDNPDTISLVNTKGAVWLFSFLPTMTDLERVSSMRPGTPVTFSFTTIYSWDESGGRMSGFNGVTEMVAVSGGKTDASVCNNVQEMYGNFSVDKTSGNFCDYNAGTGGTPDTVSIRNGKGLYRVVPRLDVLDKMKALSELEPGTPISYAMTIVYGPDNEESGGETAPPSAVMSAYEVTGTPVSGACEATSK
ncbi:MAG: hypothetical protein LBT40_12600 [Deltaproteobacteria bacterium]|jgi:hypothetical protein|nr:hypothetical protein [Deltaproteobacteria bacterium]